MYKYYFIGILILIMSCRATYDKEVLINNNLQSFRLDSLKKVEERNNYIDSIFNYVSSKNNIKLYSHFINSFPNSNKINIAKKSRKKLFFDKEKVLESNLNIDSLLEINACDLHIGKIGIDGDDYSIDIARQRMIDALQHLVKRASGFYINQILFVVGNDFLNSDGDWPVPSTTKGTPQFNTDKHIDTYRAGRKLIIECVEMLSEIAPVHIDVIPGNHDRESMMHIGDALEMFYENNGNVTVNNDMRMMKAYHYGKCLIVNDHGDGPKLNDLPGIVSQRYRNVWSEVRHVEVHRGHYHTNKSYKMQAVEELNGLTVRNLSSMTATDEWHDMKGYVGNIKKASAFVWNKYNGVQAKLNYNVPIN